LAQAAALACHGLTLIWQGFAPVGAAIGSPPPTAMKRWTQTALPFSSLFLLILRCPLGIAFAVHGSPEVAELAAGREARAAAAQAMAAAAGEAATQAHKQAEQGQLQLTLAANTATASFERTRALREQAQTVAAETRAMTDTIPAVIQKASQRAVVDVETEAIGRMNAEVREVAESFYRSSAARASSTAVVDRARARAAALPFQRAKLRATKSMNKYAAQAQELVNTLSVVGAKALESETKSRELKKRGPFAARASRRFHRKAEKALDTMKEMKEEAKQLDLVARAIQKGLGQYDVAAEAAAAAASLQSPWAASESRELPMPPPPLMPPPPPPALVLVPAPAPAPMAMVAPPPAPALPR